MRKSFSLFTLTAMAFLTLIVPSTASAQWGRNNDDRYYERNLHTVIFNLKNCSREFARRVERDVDRRQFDGRRTGDRIKGVARGFRNAADDLEDDWRDRRHDRLENRIVRVLDLGFDMDRIVSIAGLSADIQRDWQRIRRDLGALERYYSDYRRYDRRDERNSGNWSYGRNSTWRFPF